MQKTCRQNTLQADKYSEQKVYKYISVCIIIYCIAIRCYYYIQSKFLWQDEAWLFFSLYKSDFLNVLTQNNVFFQTYPSLFGIISWVVITFFGVSTYAIRLFPFVCSCFYFILLFFVAKKIKDTKYATICLAISTFNVILLNYCDEFKQYSLEACITLGLVLFYLNNEKISHITYKHFLLFVFSILLSIPAPFIVLVIILCYFFRYIKSSRYEKRYLKILFFLRNNFFQLICLLFLSIIYYCFCLRNGDANNGNAWESGMIPCDHEKLLEWIYNNFFVILSRLMSNSHRTFEGSIFLLLSFVGFLLIAKENNAFSRFVKILIPIFIVSICHIYSLGNVMWGTQGARLSIYILPIFILSSGYSVHYILNESIYIKRIFTKIEKIIFLIKTKNKYIFINKCHKNLIINVVFIVFCAYLSIFMIMCMNEWHYNNFSSYNNTFNILKQNEKDIIISHSSVWYSVEYYKIYKNYNLKIEKLGNQITPTSEYPPLSETFTSGFMFLKDKASKNRKIVVFVQQFLENNIYRFIDRCGFSIENYNFGEFYILVCSK